MFCSEISAYIWIIVKIYNAYVKTCARSILGLRYFYDSTNKKFKVFFGSNKQYLQTFINKFIMLNLNIYDEWSSFRCIDFLQNRPNV